MDAPPELRDRIDGIIRDALSIDVRSHDMDLIDTGLLDSLSLVTLIAELEQSFGIELPLDDFDVNDFRTVERMARFVIASGGLP
jgi:D-alanine--poly(phosphoribitol) ligase subunit 2